MTSRHCKPAGAQAPAYSDGVQPKMLRRARRALRASYPPKFGQPRCDDFTDCADLIADLGHWADAKGLDFEDVVESALKHWRCEREVQS